MKNKTKCWFGESVIAEGEIHTSFNSWNKSFVLFKKSIKTHILLLVYVPV